MNTQSPLLTYPENKVMFLKDDALILHGLTDSIVGASDCGRLVYDYRKVIDIFMKKNDWSEEEAVEWVDYNVMGVQPNGAGFIMMFDREMIDMDEIESKIGSDE